MHADIAPAAQLVTILAARAPECREKLGKLAKRAAKYGQTISWTEQPRTEDKSFTRPDGKRVERLVELIDLQITGGAPRCGEYVFEASLERAPGGVLIASSPEVTVGKLGREWDGRCDHCGSQRARVYGFVVRKGRTRKVVGKSCLRDHLGTDVPANLARQFAFLRELEGFAEEEGGWGGFGGRWSELTQSVIATTRAAIALWGWRPSSHEGMTTAGYVDLIHSRVRYDSKGREVMAEERKALKAELAAHADRYEAEGEAVLNWARNLKPRNDYLHNLKVALAGEVVVAKTFNLVVSACAAFDRQKEAEDTAKAERLAREGEEATMAQSAWLGTVGDKIVTTAKLVNRRVLSNEYGDSLIFKFWSEEGAVLTWITSSTPRVDGQPLELRRTYKLTGTVKSQGEFRDVKETRLIRCKLEGTK